MPPTVLRGHIHEFFDDLGRRRWSIRSCTQRSGVRRLRPNRNVKRSVTTNRADTFAANMRHKYEQGSPRTKFYVESSEIVWMRLLHKVIIHGCYDETQKEGTRAGNMGIRFMFCCTITIARML